MDGQQLARLISQVIGSVNPERPDRGLAPQPCYEIADPADIRAPWRDGELQLTVAPVVAIEFGHFQTTTVTWRAPDPAPSVVWECLTRYIRDDGHYCTQVSCTLLGEPERIWLPLWRPGAVWVGGGPERLEGWYGVPDPLPVLSDRTQEPVSTYTEFYWPAPQPSADVYSVVTSNLGRRDPMTPEQLVALFPDLCQCRLDRDAPSLYRQPDGSWDRQHPDHLPELWVHTLEDWVQMRIADRVLVPERYLPLSELALYQQRYQIQHGRGHYLLTRVPSITE